MLRLFFNILLLITLLALFQFIIGWQEFLDFCLNFIRSNNNPFLFILVMGIGCALPFSLSLCYLYAGAAFPFFIAWPLCLFGLFISSSFGYMIGRFILPRHILDSLLSRFKLQSPKLIHIVNANFFVRAIPGIPYFIQNILLGGIATPFKTYIIVNLIVQGLIGAVMIFIGSSIVSDYPLWQKISVFTFLVFSLFCIQRILAYFYSKHE